MTAYHPSKLLLAFFLCFLLLCGCGQDVPDESKIDTAAIDYTLAEMALREEKARMLFDKAKVLIGRDKVAGLIDVGHLYSDTKAGCKAWRDAIITLVDKSVDEPLRALKELKLFRHRRPHCDDVLVAANIFFNGVKKSTLERPAEVDVAKRNVMAAEGLEILVSIVDDIKDRPEFAADYGIMFEVGQAYLWANRPADAEEVFARIETFETPVEDTKRVTLLIRRADLWRSHLGDKKKSLDLFRKARTLQATLGDNVPMGNRKHVDDSIRALEEELKRS